MKDGHHQCPINGCTRPVPASQLMCRAHWRLVPAHLGQRVYRAWRHGDGAGTQAHILAMNAAIEAVHAQL